MRPEPPILIERRWFSRISSKAFHRLILRYYFDTAGLSNVPTEAINLLIKKIKRVGHGFRNFDNYRLRLLLHCGVDWNALRATPIGGRLPRFVA